MNGNEVYNNLKGNENVFGEYDLRLEFVNAK